MLTPLQAYQEELRRLNDLQAHGLKEDAFAAGAEKAAHAFDKASKAARKAAGDVVDYSDMAAKGMDGFLGDAAANIVGGSFNKIGADFEKMVSNVLKQAIIANLQIAIMGSTNAASQGNAMGGFISAGLSALGSMFGGGGSGMPDDVPTRGGRADGGNVSKGGLYPVTERGTELLTMGGNQYLLAGDDGYIKSAESMRSESQARGPSNGASAASPAMVMPAIQVNVINQGKPAEVESQKQRQGSNGAMMIDLVLREVAKDIRQGGGAVSGAIESTYGSSRAAGASQ